MEPIIGWIIKGIIVLAIFSIIVALIKVCHKFYRAAYYDSIIDCPNWSYMYPILEKKTLIKKEPYNFVHFDVKDFKMINEFYGHKKGDELLQNIANHIKTAGEWVEEYARCDNDNFAIITKPISEEELEQHLWELFDKITELPGVNDYKVYYRCGAVKSEQLAEKENVIADLAKMAQSLNRKQNCTEIRFYTEQMKEDMLRGNMLKQELPDAIRKGHILVYYQPKYDTYTEKLVGAEALVRWKYQGKELISPAAFAPLFEKNNAILTIDEFVLDQVCETLQFWKYHNYPIFPISVNLSRVQLNRFDLVETICSIVKKHDVDPSLIDIELTESAAYDDMEYLNKVMQQLREFGFRISMDDFGTGYSSLSLLSTMPLDTLKIDRSFITDITDEENQRKRDLVRDVIKMSKDLDITSLAEGVENRDEVDLLRAWDCDQIQGYYYGKPMPRDEFELLLMKQRKN